MSFQRWVGSHLRSVRAGERRLVANNPRLAARSAFPLESPNFRDGGAMPERCAGAGVGDDLPPALRWSGVPPEAVELALVVQDADAPLPWPITHLIAFGLDPRAGGVPQGAQWPKGGLDCKFGRASFGWIGYKGPRPVAGHGPHRYVFQMFVLGKTLRFESPPDLTAITNAMAGSVLARATLTGVYERP